jgi:hypothetical protein
MVHFKAGVGQHKLVGFIVNSAFECSKEHGVWHSGTGDHWHGQLYMVERLLTVHNGA